MDTRRVYISSLDTKKDDVNYSRIVIDVSSAKIGCLPSEALSLALVKCSLPATLTALPMTITTSINTKDDVSVFTFQASADGSTYGAIRRIYFNQNSDLLNPSYTNAIWDCRTTQAQILQIIQDEMTANGGGVISVDYANRLVCVSGAINIYGSHWSSPKILQCLGLPSDFTGGAVSTSSAGPERSPVNVASALNVCYIKINEFTQTFCSMHKGGWMDIIGSIPIDLTNTSLGTDVSTAGLSNSQILYTNHAMQGAHKAIASQQIPEFVLELVDDNGKTLGTQGQEWNCCIEVQTLKSA